MKLIPTFMMGAFRGALEISLEETVGSVQFGRLGEIGRDVFGTR